MQLNQVVDLIGGMLNSGNADLIKHAQTLLGPRTRGSVTSKSLDQMNPTIEMVEFQPPKGAGIPGCRYFQAEMQGIGGHMGAMSLKKALENGLQVSCRCGKHGYELFVDRGPEGVVMLPTDTVTVVLGPDETGTMPEVVWTWHPGPVLASSRNGLADETAVKIHNG